MLAPGQGTAGAIRSSGQAIKRINKGETAHRRRRFIRRGDNRLWCAPKTIFPPHCGLAVRLSRQSCDDAPLDSRNILCSPTKVKKCLRFDKKRRAVEG